MNEHMNSAHHVVKHNGAPVAVVIPYEDYLRMVAGEALRTTVPHEVAGLVIRGYPLIRAWREHLGLTQTVVAERMGITQPAYAQMESPDANPRPVTLKRIAEAMRIDCELLRSGARRARALPQGRVV